MTFASRNKSRWALEVLVQRFTRGLLDWESFRAELLRETGSAINSASSLANIPATKLWLLRQALTSHHFDAEAEQALLVTVSERVLAGDRFDKSALPALAVNLLGAGLDEYVRQLLTIYTDDTYLRHAVTAELAHPRFGGSLDALLARFNQIYRRFGLETLTTDGPGAVPFTQLTAQPAERIVDGPLITVIMSCWSPGEELLLAVRSVIDQSYQNWELLVTDDASPAEYGSVLDEVAAMDPRVRVLRNATNAGTYVRRNEAMDLARGEFVTMQDSDDWSHPRRLEIQARDLQNAPQRLANIIYNVRLTPDLSLYSERGMQLGLCEPALMFRREKVLEQIGYFDDVRKAADREFRQRLEAATGVPVSVVGPEIPLVLMLADTGSLSGSDFRGKWVHPARIAYRSSMLRAHGLISDGEQSPVFPPRQTTRTLDAPEALLGRSIAPSQLDLLVILDGRSHAGRAPFLAGVVEEIRAALESGLSVGVMHSDSLQGGKQQGYFDLSLQRLVDEEGLHRIIPGQQVAASTVVVRHAVAAQGHSPEPMGVTSRRVVIVEDPTGGDRRGETFAKRDVTGIVEAWFAVEPSWQSAALRPLPPTIESVVVKGDELRIVVKYSPLGGAVSLELRGSRAVPLPLSPIKSRTASSQGEEPAEALAAARLSLSAIDGEPFRLIAEVDAYRYVLDVETPRVLTLEPKRFLIRRPNQKLQLVGGDVLDSPQGGELPLSLHARVSAIQIRDGRMTLSVDTGEHARLTRVVAIRDVHGRLRRRGMALNSLEDGRILASRQVKPLAELRWQLFGVFQTPVGRVQYPLSFDGSVQEAKGDEWHILPLGDHSIHVVSGERRKDVLSQGRAPATQTFGRWLRTRARSVL